MTIFSFCLLLFPLFIVIFDLGVVSLTMSFLGDTAIPIYGGLEQESFSYVMTLLYGLLAVSIPMVFCCAISTLKQLLVCYVELENGTLVRLRWQPRRNGSAQAFAVSKSLESITNVDSSNTYRTLTKAKGLFDAISYIQNPQLISDYVEGRLGGCPIECNRLGNIQLVRQTKKRIVILADTMFNGKTKRKKIKICCFYCDMERLVSICGGGQM